MPALGRGGLTPLCWGRNDAAGTARGAHCRTGEGIEAFMSKSGCYETTRFGFVGFFVGFLGVFLTLNVHRMAWKIFCAREVSGISLGNFRYSNFMFHAMYTRNSMCVAPLV